MGFFDSLNKLAAVVESGELEKKLNQAADSIEKVLDTAEVGMHKADVSSDRLVTRVERTDAAVSAAARKLSAADNVSN